MKIYCLEEISIENNHNINNFKDYLNFVIENETKSLNKFNTIKPKLYIFDENEHITLLEWHSKDWNKTFSTFKSIFKTYIEKINDIIGYCIVWQSSIDEINIVINYSDEYEEVFEKKAYIYKFSKIADYIIVEPLKIGKIRKEFFELT